MRSDARKRLAEQSSHQIHHDPAVCELIERERRAAAEKAWDEGYRTGGMALLSGHRGGSTNPYANQGGVS